MDNKKAESIKVLYVGKLTWITDYFIIASGNSTVHTRSIAEALLNDFREQPVSVEGLETGNWILIDYDDAIVHIFTPETRERYKIEKLWSDSEDRTPLLPSPDTSSGQSGQEMHTT